MIGWLRTRIRNQPIIALYFEFENELKFYNLEAKTDIVSVLSLVQTVYKCYQQTTKVAASKERVQD